MELRRQNQQVLGEMSEQKLLRAVYSERQLEEVLVDFWFNHFNVFAGKGQTRIYLDRVRARRDSPARARQLPRPARRDGAQPGDALLSRQLAEQRSRRRRAAPLADRGAIRAPMDRRPKSGRRQARPEPGARRADVRRTARARPGAAAAAAARDQRELRARAAWSCTRSASTAATRSRTSSRSRAFTGWTISSRAQAVGLRVRGRAPRSQARSCVLGQTIADGGVRGRRARARLCSRRIRRPRGSSPPSSRAASSRTIRPQALVDRAAAKFRDHERRPARGRARDPDVAGVLRRAEAYRAKVKTPFEFVAQRAARDRRARSRTRRAARPQRCSGPGHAALLAQPPTGYNDRRTCGSTRARCSIA